MLIRKKHVRLSFIWVLVNFVGITTGTLVAFFLYALLTLNHNGVALGSSELLVRLAICGAVQGFIVSVLQTMAFVLTKCKLVKWLMTNMLSMVVGMVLPTAYAIALQTNFQVNSPFDQYIMAGWIVSWLLAGAFGGMVLGETAAQKIRWGVLNAAAYLYWGVAAALGMRLLGIALYNMPTISSGWMTSFGGLTLLLAMGAWLHSYVFRGVVRLKRH